MARWPGCVRLDGESLGTTWQVQVHAPTVLSDRLREVIEDALGLVVRQMSHWEPDSDLSRFNAAAAGSHVPLPQPLLGLLQDALQVARDSGGAFDPAIGALARAWGFGPGRAHLQPGFVPPDAATADRIRLAGGWRRLRIDPLSQVAFQPGGVELDLSAIAKGFAVDELSRRLLAEGCETHLVEIGGELKGAGVKPDGEPWWVGIEPPEAGARVDETLVALCDRAIATSGDYRRGYEREGRRISHTIDPRTGLAVENGLASVTVVSDECWHADAVSTALLVLGADAGRAFADRHDVAARFLRRTPTGYVESHSAAWAYMLL